MSLTKTKSVEELIADLILDTKESTIDITETQLRQARHLESLL